MQRLTFGLAFAFCLSATTVLAQDPPGLRDIREDRTPLGSAITRYFQLGSMRDTNNYRAALVDLNGDGEDDAVVLVEGPSWCEAGGCSLLVFEKTPSGFRFISRSTITEGPIRVSDRAVRGWKTLIVHTRGVGDVTMPFDGKGYPVNAAVQFLAPTRVVDDARVILTKY